jgi:branched-chain amino acid transport system permease protein
VEYGVMDTTPFSFNFITEAMIICVIGGRKSFYGPIVGTVIYIISKDFVSMFTDFWLLIIAIVIVVLVVVAPDGVCGSLEKAVKRMILKRKGATQNG